MKHLILLLVIFAQPIIIEPQLPEPIEPIQPQPIW